MTGACILGGGRSDVLTWRYHHLRLVDISQQQGPSITEGRRIVRNAQNTARTQPTDRAALLRGQQKKAFSHTGQGDEPSMLGFLQSRGFRVEAIINRTIASIQNFGIV